jgi:alkyl hydroperoxide reductase subunit D
MDFLNSIKELIPDYAKDIRLNLDGTIARSSLDKIDAIGVALSAAFAARSRKIIDIILASGELTEEQSNGALAAAALMGMNNAWYPYVDMTGDNEMKNQPAQLRMNVYTNHGGVEKRRFETYALAASIIGKCHFCIKSHFDLLKQEGMSTQQLRDVGRIAAVINAASQVIDASAKN